MISILITSVVALSHCDTQKGDDPVVKTNYYDLPTENRQTLQTILKTEDLSMLSANNLEVLKEYLDNRVTTGQNPLNNSVTTAYFWHIYNALPDFVDSRERHHGYYVNQNRQALTEKLKAYAIYRIDRSPENIKKAFGFARPYLKHVVSQAEYDHHRFGEIIDGLLKTYRGIVAVENYKEKLNAFYNRYYTSTGKMKVEENENIKEVYNSAYGFSAYELNEQLSAELGFDRYSPYYGSYYLSFWMRRIHEQNAEVVKQILTEIKAVYK